MGKRLTGRFSGADKQYTEEVKITKGTEEDKEVKKPKSVGYIVDAKTRDIFKSPPKCREDTKLNTVVLSVLVYAY